MEDRDRILDYTKPVRLPDDCSKSQKNFTQGYFYREIGRYKNAVPSEFQWAAEDKLINKTTYEELKCQLPDSPRSTFLMVFSPDGKKVASTHGNHNVYVTDLTTGKNIQTLSGHPRTPWCIAFHPSSNQILASGCLGGQVRVWDLHGGSEVWTAGSQTVIASLAFHPVDRMLVIATYNELHFWDWSQPEPFAKCSTKSGREKVRYVSFDRLGNKLITGIANPVNVPSQWDRINVVNSQPPMTSTTTTTTTTTTSFNSTPPTTVVSSQPSTDQGRSLTAWYRNFMNRYNELVSMSRNTPTIDRGTDPMDLLDLRNNGSNSEGSTSNPSPSTSNSQANPSSPLRFKITRSGGRPYRSLNSRESSLRFRIHSSVLRNINGRSSQSSNSPTTASSTTVTQSSSFTNLSSMSSPLTPSPSVAPRLRRCAFNFGPTARTWCLTLSPESSGLFSTRNTTQSSSSGAVTNPTYTSYSDRGIFSTRESSSNSSERTQFSVVRPYRLLFDDSESSRTTLQRGTQNDPEGGSSNRAPADSNSNPEQTEGHRDQGHGSTPNSPERRSSSRDTMLNSPDDLEIERELQRPSSDLHPRRQDTGTASSTPNVESSYNSETSQNNRPSSIFQLTPVDLRNVSPVRRFREDANSDGELTGRENHVITSQCLFHPRPVPRFQVRSRLMQDQQSQLHLITNRETHGLNLQNNQNLRRQLSFRPGGQFVLSRHSNSPFQPRVPHHIDSLTQESSPSHVKNNTKELRPEIPSVRSSFTASVSSSASTSEGGTSTPSSSSNVFPPSSVASNLSFTGEGSSRQLPEQINRRLFDRVKMMLRDRIRNSSENASTDSTVNYSRISGESEADTLHLRNSSLESDEGNASRGLGPRGADPMLSSASENLDTSNELLTNSGNSSPVPGNANGLSSNSTSLNMSQSELLDPWESETDTVPFSLSSPLSLNDVLTEQPPPTQETTHGTAENAEQSQTPTTSNNDSIDNSNSSSPEFSMRQGIQLLSLHIENMQRLCWARIEILQLQKIRRMWEDLTNQIRHFHNIIQNRTSGDNSVQNDNSNSGGDIPGMRNLAISSSPVPEPSPRSSMSPEASTSSNDINNYKELRKVAGETDNQNSSNRPSAPSAPFSDDPPGGRPSEEPQPGPSGLSTPNNSREDRNSILHFEYRVYRLLRDIIQKTRRPREGREVERGNTSAFRRQNQSFGLRNSSRTRFRCHRTRNLLHSSILRSRAISRELDSIWQTWRNERPTKSSQPGTSTSSSEANLPSTSAPKTSSSSDACQSCGQKKRPVKEFCRQKKRCVDTSESSEPSCSASKVLKNNVGERSEAPGREGGEGDQSTSASSSQTQESLTNDLLKQMLQTMDTMLRFQREAFQRTKDLSGDRSGQPPPPPLPLPSSDDDSDSDHNDSNQRRELFTRDESRNSHGSQESVMNSMQDIVQLRVKRLLGFLVKSLNQFFGKNFSNLNQVLDEQIFRLYMLLDLALELTDLLLDQLNARSRDLERSWSEENLETHNTDHRERNWMMSRTGGVASRMRDRSRIFGRSSYIPPYPVNRDDYPRYRFSANPFLRSLSSLISRRLNSTSSSTTNHDRFPSATLSGTSRRKRRTARMSTTLSSVWYGRNNRSSLGSSSSSGPSTSKRTMTGNSMGSRYRSFRFDRRPIGEGIRAFDYEINNNTSSNDTNNNYSSNDDRNNNSNNNNNNNNNSSSNSTNVDNRNTSNASNNSDISNNNFLNYYFPNSSSSNNSDSGNNIIIVTGLSSGSDIITSNSNNNNRNNNNEVNNSRQSGSNTFLNQSSLPPLRSMELTLSRNESGDLSLRDERPIFWIRYGGNGETSGSSNSSDSQSRVSSFTVPVVHVNDVPVSDVSMLNQPRHRPQSPVPRVPEDIWRWRAWRPRFLHPRYVGPNPFDDQDSNDVPENIHYYRILSTSAGSHLGVYTLDPMIITDAPLSPHHRIQAWDFSKMNIPDISDREANGVVPECKIHNDASVDVSNDGHLLVTLLPSGRLSVTTMLGVYSLDWSSLGQLLYRTSFEQNAVSVSLSPTNRHLLVGLASRPVVVRDRTNMAQIFRLEGGRPSPHGGSWQSGRGRLVHMRDLEQTRETNIMSLNCIRWAPGAGQGLVYGTNTGQLKVLR